MGGKFGGGGEGKLRLDEELREDLDWQGKETGSMGRLGLGWGV